MNALRVFTIAIPTRFVKTVKVLLFVIAAPAGQEVVCCVTTWMNARLLFKAARQAPRAQTLKALLRVLVTRVTTATGSLAGTIMSAL